MYLVPFRPLILCLGALLCIASGPGLASQTLPASALASSYKAQAPELEQHYPRYAVQREDVLQVSFPLSPEFNQTLTVQPDGYINLQAAAPIHVQGLTVPQVQAEVQQAYAGVLNHPIVNVDLKDFQKPFFTVSGQVGKPGRYDLRSDTTVMEALAVAGGLSTATGKSEVFLFRRTSQEWFSVKKLNLHDLFQGRHVNEDVLLQPGDMIYVPENFITKFRKYVPYSVNAYYEPNPL